MGIFDEIAKAQVAGGGDHFRPGMGKVAIKAIRHRSGFKGVFIIGEFKVLESREKEPGKLPNAAGTSAAQVFPMSGDKNKVLMAQAAVLKLSKSIFEVAGATNLDEAALAKELEGLVQPSQPARDMVLAYETREVETKGKKWITVVDFKPLKQTGEDVAKMRATLDAEDPFVP